MNHAKPLNCRRTAGSGLGLLAWTQSRATSCIVALLLLAPRASQPQATVVSAPANDFLLRIARDWARSSPLGDLRERAFAPSDLEVRAWKGYGITQTVGIVVRRESGIWRSWFAAVETCSTTVPISVGDTASPPTRARFQREARANCAASMDNVGHGGRVFSVDTLTLIPMEATARVFEDTWNAATSAGLLALPPDVPRKTMVLDSVAYVVEVRRGNEYRASIIGHVSPPEVEADAQVQRVFDALDAFASKFVKLQSGQRVPPAAP